MRAQSLQAAVPPLGVFRIALAGLIALAVAMGIGRFAFTPILPLMQDDAGLSLKVAGWLAAANYLGYLLGALCAARVPRTWAIRGGLLLIAVVTFGMGMTRWFALWLILRLLAGIASAWVLVHVSAWALEELTTRARPRAQGSVFAGVGIGIAGAGLLCLILVSADVDSMQTWQVFGVVSALFAAAIWPAFRSEELPLRRSTARAPAHQLHWNADRVRLALCYAAFGFGYIIPATFLPAMAHQYISNPNVFGWAWPVFGAAAALSTWAAARWLHAIATRKLWALAYVLMAIGVILPVLWPGLAAILIAALLVGGTFMVATMLGLREARAVAGEQATAFIAAVTAAFAVMQVIGPLVVSAVAQLHGGFTASLVAAALVLVLAALALWGSSARAVS